MGRIWLTGPRELLLRGDRRTRRRRAALAAALLAALLSTAAAAPALADSATSLGGNPLAVYVGERGQLQAFRSGSASGIFFPNTEHGRRRRLLPRPALGLQRATRRRGSSASRASPARAASTNSRRSRNLRRLRRPAARRRVPSCRFTGYVGEPGGGPAAPSPVDADHDLRERRSAVPRSAGSSKTCRAARSPSRRWRRPTSTSTAAIAAPGIYTEGPPRFIGGTNADTGNSGRLRSEATGAGLAPWSALPGAGVGPRAPTRCGARSRARRRATAPTFDDTVRRRAGRQRRAAWSGTRTPRAPGWRPARPRSFALSRPQRRAVGTASSTRRAAGSPQGRAALLHGPAPSTPPGCRMRAGRPCYSRSPVRTPGSGAVDGGVRTAAR